MKEKSILFTTVAVGINCVLVLLSSPYYSYAVYGQCTRVLSPDRQIHWVDVSGGRE